MWVTIYTDASHMPSTNKGAWAFWAKSEEGRITRNGVLKEEVKGSTWSEMYCILNALTAVKKRWPKSSGFYLVTDSMFCINLFSDRSALTKFSQKKYKNELAIWDKLTKGCKVRFKHQKAHRGSDTIGGWLNGWCDEAARRAHEGGSSYFKAKKK